MLDSFFDNSHIFKCVEKFSQNMVNAILYKKQKKNKNKNKKTINEIGKKINK